MSETIPSIFDASIETVFAAQKSYKALIDPQCCDLLHRVSLYNGRLQQQQDRRQYVEYLKDSCTEVGPLETDFFESYRSLSYSDFDGTQTIVSPRTADTARVKRDKRVNGAGACSEDEHGSYEKLYHVSPKSLKQHIACYEPDCAFEVLQIEPLTPHFVAINDLTNRALVSSLSGVVSNISTPGLTQEDSSEDDNGTNRVQLGSDHSPATLRSFDQAGAVISTRYLQDDSVVAQDTSLAGGVLDIDCATEVKKIDACDLFFGPSPESSPQIETTPNSKNILAYTQAYVPSKYASPRTPPINYSYVPAEVDGLADPDYYTGPAVRSAHGVDFDQIDQAIDAQLRIPFVRQLHAQNHFMQTQVINVPDTYSHLPTTRISQAPFNKSLLISKRASRASGQSSSLKRAAEDPIDECSPNQDGEDEIQYLGTYTIKKPRLLPPVSVNFRSKPNKAIRQPAIPPLSTRSSSNTSSSSSNPIDCSLTGFNGQFTLGICPSWTSNFCSRTFGSEFHANGLITNTTYVPDPFSAHADLNDNDLAAALALHEIYKNCYDASFSAMLAPRSEAEEILRCEAHRECTVARLEGLSVGRYRYYQGHLTVEESVAASLCVCWEGCWCTKICTRFGDVRCPCGSGLVVGDEGDGEG